VQRLIPRSILITGAAGAIGSALAKAYSAPGVTLFLGDIAADGLKSVTHHCLALGAMARKEVVDVSDREAMRGWIGDAHASAPLDLIMAIAGISKGNIAREETAEEADEVLSVNVKGTFNTFLSALPLMRARGGGQIALMSSLAGTRGFPVAPSYSATKAAVRIYGEAWRARLKRENIHVTVINPGFIQSPMTRANPYFMPFLVETDRASRIIRKRLEKAPASITFPWPVSLGAWCLSLLPPALFSRMVLLK
jgi:NADP-dependent 3-hydroxy acid dehydrogenase YdfG